MKNYFGLFVLSLILPFLVFSSEKSKKNRFDLIDHYPNFIYAAPRFTFTSNSAKNKTNASGSVWEGVIGYQYKAPYQFFRKLEASWGGGTFTAQSDPKREIWNHQWSIEFLLGFMFPLGKDERFAITPYLGYAFYQAKNSVALSSKNAHYHANAYNSSLPIGIAFDWVVIPRMTSGFDFRTTLQFASWVTASDVSYGNAAVGIDIPKNGYRTRMTNNASWFFSFPTTVALIDHLECSFIPFYSYSRDLATAATPSLRILNKNVDGTSFGFLANIGFRF